MRLIKTAKTRLFCTYFLTLYIYWFPTIMTEFHSKNSEFLCSFTNEDNMYVGNEIGVTFLFLCFQINIAFWWNIENKQIN